MNDFTELCQYYLKRSGLNIHRLSQISSLDRTMLQRMMNGEKMPSAQFFERFLNHLMLNPEERTLLYNAYEKAKINPKKYWHKQAIIRFINSFTMNMDTNDKGEFIYFYHFIGDMPPETMLIDDYSHLMEAIYYSISYMYEHHERMDLYMNCNRYLPIIKNYIINKQFNEKKPFYCWMLAGVADKDDQAYALDTVSKIANLLPFALTFHNQLEVYSYPSHLLNEDLTFMQFSNYLITEDHVLLFDDNQIGLLIHNRDLASSFKEAFLRLKEQGDPLIMPYAYFLDSHTNNLELFNHRRLMLSFNRKLGCVEKEMQKIQSRQTDVHKLISSEYKQYFLKDAINVFLREVVLKDAMDSPLSDKELAMSYREVLSVKGSLIFLYKPEFQTTLEGLHIELWKPDLLVFDYGYHNDDCSDIHDGSSVYMIDRKLYHLCLSNFTELESGCMNHQETIDYLEQRILRYIQQVRKKR